MQVPMLLSRRRAERAINLALNVPNSTVSLASVRPQLTQTALPCLQGTWDTVALQVELASLTSKARQLDQQIAQLQTARSGIDGAIARVRERLLLRPIFQPRADDKALASRLASTFLGDREPHTFQISAACAMHAGHHVFVIEQAGRGKSLCFQLAGFMQPPPSVPSAPTPPQLTIVVSPLVALMHEQAAAINATRTYRMANGEVVAAAYVLDGGSGALTRDLDGAAPPTLEACVASLRGEGAAPPLPPGSPEALLLHRLQELDHKGNGTCVFLFVSPEKLARSSTAAGFLRAVYQDCAWRKVVIDEAHCIDEQGREFRPDYLLLRALRIAFPELIFMCLTATAPPEVVVSTCLTLGITDDLVLLRGQLKRPQMRYAVHFVSTARTKKRRICEVVRRAHESGESTLVYTNTRRTTEQLAEAMQVAAGGVAAPEIDAYHAGLTPAHRREIEANWRDGAPTTQLSATIAMGMGMDKPDLDAVVHHQLPRSISSLYQESGRAARGAERLGRWDCFFTLADVFDLLERRHGQLASSRAGHEYGWGACLDLLHFLTDADTCRHVLLERGLGGGGDCGAEAENRCRCQSDEPQCDNCARASLPARDAIIMRRNDWVPALLSVMREQEQASNSGSLSLRAFAAAWVRSSQAPTPVWVRAPLFLLALLHEVLCISFVEISSRINDDLLCSKSKTIRWSARVSIDVRGRRAAQSSPALESVRLPASMWGDSDMNAAKEIEAGERDSSDLESDSDDDVDK